MTVSCFSGCSSENTAKSDTSDRENVEGVINNFAVSLEKFDFEGAMNFAAPESDCYLDLDVLTMSDNYYYKNLKNSDFDDEKINEIVETIDSKNSYSIDDIEINGDTATVSLEVTEINYDDVSEIIKQFLPSADDDDDTPVLSEDDSKVFDDLDDSLEELSSSIMSNQMSDDTIIKNSIMNLDTTTKTRPVTLKKVDGKWYVTKEK